MLTSLEDKHAWGLYGPSDFRACNYFEESRSVANLFSPPALTSAISCVASGPIATDVCLHVFIPGRSQIAPFGVAHKPTSRDSPRLARFLVLILTDNTPSNQLTWCRTCFLLWLYSLSQVSSSATVLIEHHVTRNRKSEVRKYRIRMETSLHHHGLRERGYSALRQRTHGC